MLIVPTAALPNQTFLINLANQNARLNIYQRFWGLFMDVLVDESRIIGGVLCHNLDLIVRDPYLGFQGDFVWLDNAGTDDPIYTGLGDRFSLCYLTVADVAQKKAGVSPATVGILGDSAPPSGTTGERPSGGSPGAPTQTDPTRTKPNAPASIIILPFSYTVSAQFNGYAAGSQVSSLIYFDATGWPRIFTSLINNNIVNPDTVPISADGTYANWSLSLTA